MSKSKVDLAGLKREFLKYAPSYAQEAASDALDKLIKLQDSNVLQQGIYYVVLVDLVGSTNFASRQGNDRLSRRIQNFILSAFAAINEIPLRSSGLFVKEIGDAVLFLFTHFVDILDWRAAFLQQLDRVDSHGEEIVIRTCVHLGEVCIKDANPISLAIAQTFKIEKNVGPGQLVLTEPAFLAAWPSVDPEEYRNRDAGLVDMQGVPYPVMLHEVSEINS